MNTPNLGPESSEVLPRLVTIWCPDWPVIAAKLTRVPAAMTAGVPIAVVAADRIVARAPVLAAAGVHVGQRRRDAQRCAPEMVLVDHDPDRDARAFEPVVRAVADLVPRLEVIEPGWIGFEARGPSRYFGGERALAERLVDLVTGLVESPVGVGVADGRSTSTIAARRAATTPDAIVVVPPAASAAYLAPLPVTWLRAVGDADGDLVDVVARLGIHTLGALAALPRPDVLARFGLAGVRAHRVASGADDRVAVASEPAPERQVERIFETPVEEVAPVVFVAKQLADALVGALMAEGRVCTKVVVTAETEHGERTERAWYRDQGLSAPAIVERVRWQLEGWIAQPGGISAGIVLVRLAAVVVRADDGTQVGFWGGRSEADDAASRAVTRLAGLGGEASVTVPVWRGGRLPNERYAWVPALSVDLDRSVSRPRGRALGRGRDIGPWPGSLPVPSPAKVHVAPIPVEVVGEDGRVVRVSGRGEVDPPPARLVSAGADRVVTAWAGPWPVDQCWWERRRHRRLARFQVVTADGDALLLAVEHQRWWCVAEYA